MKKIIIITTNFFKNKKLLLLLLVEMRPVTKILWARASENSLKAMLREAIFLATCNATNVALQVARKKITCETPFCNCNCCVASCKKNRMTLYFSQRWETPLCNLKGLLFVIVALQVARKIASSKGQILRACTPKLNGTIRIATELDASPKRETSLATPRFSSSLRSLFLSRALKIREAVTV